MLATAMAMVVANPRPIAGRNSTSTIDRSSVALRRDVGSLVRRGEQLPVVEAILVGIELLQRAVGLHGVDPGVEGIPRRRVLLAEGERDADRRRCLVDDDLDAFL